MFLLSLRPLVRAFGIKVLHFDPLRRGEMRKVADKMNQPPTVQRASMLAAIGKCRHSREPHAVLDDPKKLSIRKVLSFRQTQIRRHGVESIANHAFPNSLLSVPNRSMID